MQYVNLFLTHNPFFLNSSKPFYSFPDTSVNKLLNFSPLDYPSNFYPDIPAGAVLTEVHQIICFLSNIRAIFSWLFFLILLDHWLEMWSSFPSTIWNFSFHEGLWNHSTVGFFYVIPFALLLIIALMLILPRVSFLPFFNDITNNNNRDFFEFYFMPMTVLWLMSYLNDEISGQFSHAHLWKWRLKFR